MAHGYNGKILVVDLTKGTHEIKEPDERWYRTYFGGTGIIAETLLSEDISGVDPLGSDNVAVNVTPVVPALPSVMTGLSIEIVGKGSSSTIFPSPFPSTIAALTGSNRRTKNFSSSSSSVSPWMGTVTVRVVAPGANVSFPLVVVKSAPAVAESDSVE